MERYDRAITIFSPDGHLFQVEYAQEAVKKGSVAVGIKGKDCVVIAAEKKLVAKLQDDRTIRKINKVDHHIAMTFAGLNADARILVNMARLECQSWNLSMSVPVTVEYLARYIANVKQKYTQSNGRRPFGVSAIIGGFDSDGTAHLYQTEPSGTYYEWNANCTGRNSHTVRSFLEKRYCPEAVEDVKSCVKLALRALYEVVQAGVQNIEVGVMTFEKERPEPKARFRIIEWPELQSIIKEVTSEKEQEGVYRKPKLLKQNLRKKLKQTLQNLGEEEKARQSRAVFRKLLNFPVYCMSKRISTFVSMRNEIDTKPIIEHIFTSGKECFVPCFESGNNRMEMVRLRDMEDFFNMQETCWGIKQPCNPDGRENCFNSDGLDLIIVPGVAFTVDGKRLGHGKGYYDNYLARYFAKFSHRPHTIGIAFAEQIVSDLPVESHDHVLEKVLFPN
ncbi:Proteasome subunit alpha type-7 [Trichinella patagoniensis]|uniref:Proteasome subunit alpha type-7 n=1 Tax=Trichinella patagoniensis TaxID=990121 RepID=A0A0V1A1X8_9BILA|nr:Proteasome subunit alpha type-7 [Trichinella patagoniensis]